MSDATDLRDQIIEAIDSADALMTYQDTAAIINVVMGVVQPVIDRAERAEGKAAQQTQAVIDEVLTVCDSFDVAPEGSPQYLYSLGRLDGLDWARAAVERAMGKGERNSAPYVPKERAEQAEAPIERVRALHFPVPCECTKCNARRLYGTDDQLCAHCTDLLPRGGRDGGIGWPCPTISALDRQDPGVTHRLRVHKDRGGLWLYALLDTRRPPGNQTVVAGAGQSWAEVMRRGSTYLAMPLAADLSVIDRGEAEAP